jgi:RimJ/RimL family protein N-acetyltransferase
MVVSCWATAIPDERYNPHQSYKKVLKANMPGDATFPEPLETERLVLRQYGSADAASIFELVEKNRAQLLQNFSQMAKGLSQIEEAKVFVNDKADQWNGRKAFCYGIWLKASKEQIGQIQVKNIVWEVPSAELSYFIASSSQRQGFASEAISTILRAAFRELDFKRMFVRIVPSNRESMFLANKLGFKHEGVHRSEFRCGFGDLHDVHYFSLTTDDFKFA